MNSIFKEDSWEVEKGMIPVKSFDVKQVVLEETFVLKTKLKYIKPIFFDETVRIDLQLRGKITLEINNKRLDIVSETFDKKCVVIDNGLITFNGNENSIDIKNGNSFKIEVETDTRVNQFTIIQDLKIDGCNPNN